MPANNGGQGDLVGIEINRRRRQAAEVLLKIAVGATHHGMSDQRAVLVMRTQPLGARHKQILRYEWALNQLRRNIVAQARAACAHISPSTAFDGPVAAEPVGTGEVKAAEIRSL